MEIWKVIPSHSNYEASTHGRIRHKDGLNIKSQHKSNRGYMGVGLKVGKPKHRVTRLYQVHRLVMEAFCDYSDLTVNHKDFSKENNFLENLEYMTLEDNVRHAIDGGRHSFKSKSVVQIRKNGNIIRRFDSIVDAEGAIGLHGIGKCLNDRSRSCGGYIWFNESDYLYIANQDELSYIRKKTTKRWAKPVVKINHNGDIVQKFTSATVAASDGELSIGSISISCRTGRFYYGYRWEYINPND